MWRISLVSACLVPGVSAFCSQSCNGHGTCGAQYVCSQDSVATFVAVPFRILELDLPLTFFFNATAQFNPLFRCFLCVHP